MCIYHWYILNHVINDSDEELAGIYVNAEETLENTHKVDLDSDNLYGLNKAGWPAPFTVNDARFGLPDGKQWNYNQTKWYKKDVRI